MKRILTTFIIIVITGSLAAAQTISYLQVGVKGGADFASLQKSTSATFTTGNQYGYLGGFWARFGAAGFNFQPEVYATTKNVGLTTKTGSIVNAKFTTIDFPLLIGAKIGEYDICGRFYTGPVISTTLDKYQTVGGAPGKVFSLNSQDQNFAWQFGAGLDIYDISIDVRYEDGITKQVYGYNHTRVSLFNVSLSYSLLKL